MYIEDFGKKRVKLYRIEGTDELIQIEFFHKRKKYIGIIDLSGRLLVPITNYSLLEAFATNDRMNYCFTIINEENGKYESFHLNKREDGRFHLGADIKGNEITNCRLVGTVKDDYWFIESTTAGITEVSVYDVRNAKILTPGFTEISFEEKKSRVLAYVEKELYTEIDHEMIYLTSLLSYIDYEGNFVTPFYDPETDLYYDAKSYNFDKSFKSFYRFIEAVTLTHRTSYIEKSEHVTDVLADMFANLYLKEDIKPKGPAKMLEFRRKSNDEK